MGTGTGTAYNSASSDKGRKGKEGIRDELGKN